ncbi:MAG TPA: methyltransferase domain-containing protein [Kofleriaceae bacterium]|jgi:predicted methyltransferase
MKTARIVLAALLAVAGCKKAETTSTGSGGSAGSGSAAVGSAGSAGSGSAVSDADKLAKGMADAQAAATKEAARWTPELTKAVVALRDQAVTDTKTMLTAILASPHRVPGNSDRDGARHPIETLAFFGVQPTSTVLEIGPGGGWYTELLAPLLADHGKLIVAGPDANAPAGKMSTVNGKSLDLFLAKSPELFGKVQRVSITTADTLALGPDGSVDIVLVIREMHDWQRDGELEKYLTAIHAVLKPGGTFGLVAHRAVAGTKGEETAKSGYLAEQWVIDRVTAAGFALADKSEINANPKDTKDYPKGVWTLPPGYREGDQDKAKYTAIGESDRMTLKFTKK